MSHIEPMTTDRLIAIAKAVGIFAVLILILWLWGRGETPPPAAETAPAEQSGTPAAPETAQGETPAAGETPTVDPLAAAAADLPPATDVAVEADGSSHEVNPGEEYYRMGLYPEALAFWRAQAERGDVYAAYRLGVEYHDGKPRVTERNDAEALKWYLVAAKGGHPKAQFDLGSIYEAGQGVEASLPKAAEWYKRSADGGLAEAQWNIATMFETGEGVEKNEVEALKYYFLAAAQGFNPPSFDETGKPVEGAPTAKDALAARMTPEQIIEATEAAQAFKAAPVIPEE